MTELEKVLSPLMEIADDETFCTSEYEAIKNYIEEKEFIGVTTEEWQEIEARGYDTGWLIECYIPYLPTEKKMKTVKQVWDELTDVSVDDNMNLLQDYRCWKKGACAYDIWSDLEHLFGISVAIDLMHLPESEV